jgi:hypothetical protein
MHTQGTY